LEKQSAHVIVTLGRLRLFIATAKKNRHRAERYIRLNVRPVLCPSQLLERARGKTSFQGFCAASVATSWGVRRTRRFRVDGTRSRLAADLKTHLRLLPPT
jgi:hypothetical protein